MTAVCLWCDAPILARKLGAHRKKFCSPQCRGLFHNAARRWAEDALARGELSVGDLKARVASYTTEGSATAHREG